MLHNKVDPRKLAYDQLAKEVFAYFYNKCTQFCTPWKMVYTSKGCTLKNKIGRLRV